MTSQGGAVGVLRIPCGDGADLIDGKRQERLLAGWPGTASREAG
jgi:hypothetical protein